MVSSEGGGAQAVTLMEEGLAGSPRVRFSPAGVAGFRAEPMPHHLRPGMLPITSISEKKMVAQLAFLADTDVPSASAAANPSASSAGKPGGWIGGLVGRLVVCGLSLRGLAARLAAGLCSSRMLSA